MNLKSQDYMKGKVKDYWEKKLSSCQISGQKYWYPIC